MNKKKKLSSIITIMNLRKYQMSENKSKKAKAKEKEKEKTKEKVKVKVKIKIKIKSKLNYFNCFNYTNNKYYFLCLFLKAF
jgi:hypothetical protein